MCCKCFEDKINTYNSQNRTVLGISKRFWHQLFLFITPIEGHVHYSQVTHYKVTCSLPTSLLLNHSLIYYSNCGNIRNEQEIFCLWSWPWISLLFFKTTKTMFWRIIIIIHLSKQKVKVHMPVSWWYINNV